MRRIHDLGWWYWFLTASLLASGLLAWPAGIYLAMALCAVQLAHVLLITGDVTSFPVQVRAAYVLMLLAGLWGPFQWIHWMLLAGTSARLLVGYCLLGRTLSLAPWNRRFPLTLPLIKRTFLSLQTALPPCGEVFRRMSLERVQA